MSRYPITPTATPELLSSDFQTPAAVAKYMVSLLPSEALSILEPTPGNGNLILALMATRPAGTILKIPECYWQIDKTERYDAVIGNLPFSHKTWRNIPAGYKQTGMKVTYEQLDILMTMSDNLVMLMPWFTIIDSDVRLKELMRFGLVSITTLPRKTFNYARIQTCIFKLQKGYKGDTIFKSFDSALL